MVRRERDMNEEGAERLKRRKRGEGGGSERRGKRGAEERRGQERSVDDRG